MNTINIDTAKCSGHGRCYTLAPDFFDCDDEGFPVVLNETVADDAPGLANLLAAADNCPERAITVTKG